MLSLFLCELTHFNLRYDSVNVTAFTSLRRKWMVRCGGKRKMLSLLNICATRLATRKSQSYNPPIRCRMVFSPLRCLFSGQVLKVLYNTFSFSPPNTYLVLPSGPKSQHFTLLRLAMIRYLFLPSHHLSFIN